MNKLCLSFLVMNRLFLIEVDISVRCIKNISLRFVSLNVRRVIYMKCMILISLLLYFRFIKIGIIDHTKATRSILFRV